MKNVARTAVVCVLVGITASVASANLIANGSFESPAITSNFQYVTGIGDNFPTNCSYTTAEDNAWVLIANPANSGGYTTAPQNGSQYVQLYNAYTAEGRLWTNLQQDMTLLSTTTAYTVSFYTESDVSFNASVYVYTHDGAGNRTNWNEIYTISDEPAQSGWTLHSFTWTPLSPSSGIDFVAKGGNQYFIDNVSMVMVPEPATAAILAFGGLLIRRRK